MWWRIEFVGCFPTCASIAGVSSSFKIIRFLGPRCLGGNDWLRFGDGDAYPWRAEVAATTMTGGLLKQLPFLCPRQVA